MSAMTNRDLQHVFESLCKGLVPERGIDAFSVGIEKVRGELHRQLELARVGEGTIKFLRGGYGCGKTFMARLALLDAHERNFATSFVVVSDNDLRFHRFDDVYRKVMKELGTASCPRGAMGDILDRWIGRVEEALIAAGEDEDADDFDAKVRKRVDADKLFCDLRVVIIDEVHAIAGSDRGAHLMSVLERINDYSKHNFQRIGLSATVGNPEAILTWLQGSSKRQNCVVDPPKKPSRRQISVIFTVLTSPTISPSRFVARILPLHG